jgi:hypothetical protein
MLRRMLARMRTQTPALLAAVLMSCLAADSARAMCGCILGPPRPQPKIGETTQARIINKSSKVILARDGDTTVMTMSNDFEGATADFGIVIPVPAVIKREDVKVVDDQVFASLEAFSAPKVTEIYEPDPCDAPMGGRGMAMAPSMESAKAADEAPRSRGPRASDFGVKIESHFFAGEYEIAVLAGKDSSGLVKWLQLFKYEVPNDAQEVLGSYIKQDMHFFVARVHLKEMGTGKRDLRPIQVRYKTPKLMLPIRLGMVNADGPQELMVFALTPQARVETTTYRTVRMPAAGALPLFAKDNWTEVYGAMFDEQTKRESMRVVFMEHASQWMPEQKDATRAGMFWGPSGFVTRLHFKYTKENFPEDLTLQVTGDSAPFSIGYTAVHPAPNTCNHPGPPQARAREQQMLANLTGWPMETVMQRAGMKVGSETGAPTPPKEPKWYEKLWQ